MKEEEKFLQTVYEPANKNVKAALDPLLMYRSNVLLFLTQSIEKNGWGAGLARLALNLLSKAATYPLVLTFTQGLFLNIRHATPSLLDLYSHPRDALHFVLREEGWQGLYRVRCWWQKSDSVLRQSSCPSKKKKKKKKKKKPTKTNKNPKKKQKQRNKQAKQNQIKEQPETTSTSSYCFFARVTPSLFQGFAPVVVSEVVGSFVALAGANFFINPMLRVVLGEFASVGTSLAKHLSKDRNPQRNDAQTLAYVIKNLFGTRAKATDIAVRCVGLWSIVFGNAMLQNAATWLSVCARLSSDEVVVYQWPSRWDFARSLFAGFMGSDFAFM